MGRLLCVATAWTWSKMAMTILSTSWAGVTGTSGGVAIFTSMSKPTDGSTPCTPNALIKHCICFWSYFFANL